MSDEQNGLFASVDALLEQAAAPDALPVPAERKRLREAAGLSQDQVAKALDVRRETVTGWEAGRTEPRPPARAAYIRLLDGLAARFPAPESPSDSALGPRTGPSVSSQPHAPTSPVLPAASPAAPVRAVSARPPVARKTAAAPVADARFAHGPLAVVDGDGVGLLRGGLVLDCPLADPSGTGRLDAGRGEARCARLHRSGKDADPLIVLTAAAVRTLRPAGRRWRTGAPVRLPGGPQGRQAARAQHSGS